MPKNEYIVIDLETTGLDPATDKIIEVAAVKIKRSLIVDEFSSLIDPQILITEEISLLTGIDNTMVEGQPKIEEIIPALRDFIGASTIIAHNAPFDSAFLEPFLKSSRGWLDSVVLAQIAYPKAGRYSLEKLTRLLEINNNAAHRALSDALATAELFLAIKKRLAELSPSTKKLLAQIGEGDQSGLGRFIMEQTSCASGSGKKQIQAFTDFPATEAQENRETLKDERSRSVYDREIDEEYRLSEDEIASYFSPEGLYEQRLEGFEDRPQQLEMALAVAESFNEKQHLIVEAGTGTGKSLAYLLPAVLFALNSERQVAVSTHTINLQEQLLKKDIPMLQKLLGRSLVAAVLKGRGNYLCRNMFNSISRHPGDNIRYFLMRLAVWLGETEEGDSAELALNGFEKWKWNLICAGRENCAAPHCSYAKTSCFVARCRSRAEKADLIILNHSLLLSNTSMERGFLPPLPYLILDEAHHLEKVAEDQLSVTVDFYTLLGLTGRLKRSERGRAGGTLEFIRKQLETLIIADEAKTSCQDKIEAIGIHLDYLMPEAEEFFRLMRDIALPEAGCQGYYPARLRVLPALRLKPLWQLLINAGNSLQAGLNSLTKELLAVVELLLLAEIEAEQAVSGKEELKSIAMQLRETSQTIEACLEKDAENHVVWIEFIDPEKWPSLHMAPLELGEILKSSLFDQAESIVLTSATLTAAGSFTYFKQRVGLDLLEESPREMVLPSPFYYQDQALFAICNDLPDWSKDSEYRCREAIAKALIELLEASKGRALVLFTSHDQLKAVYEEIKRPLAQKGITVLAHGISGNPAVLLQWLKKEEHCCILGANSFWEGVDVVGSALSMVIVVRLPFWPPNTPTIAARMEKIDAEGKSSFAEYSLPQSIIRFKQGFGRLIRSCEDTGVFCVLDKRICEKQYGRTFIKSLPSMTRLVAPTEEVAEAVRRWLG